LAIINKLIRESKLIIPDSILFLFVAKKSLDSLLVGIYKIKDGDARYTSPDVDFQSGK
jgi:hypothetical protein